MRQFLRPSLRLFGLAGSSNASRVGLIDAREGGSGGRRVPGSGEIAPRGSILLNERVGKEGLSSRVRRACRADDRTNLSSLYHTFDPLIGEATKLDS